MIRRAAALMLVVLSTAGCALFTRDAARALTEADGHAARNDYPAALAAYDTYLTRYPDDDRVPHVRAVRTVMAELIAVRAELATLRDRRDGEVTRLRQELGARQAEVTRLREDLEALKRTDLQMERRRR